MVKKKKDADVLTEEQLVSAIKEVNEVLEFEDNGIATDISSDEMQTELQDCFDQFKVDEDVLTQGTADVLKALGCKLDFKIKEEKGEEAVKEKKKVEEKVVKEKKKVEEKVVKKKEVAKKKVVKKKEKVPAKKKEVAKKKVVKKKEKVPAKKKGIGIFVMNLLKEFKSKTNQEIVNEVKKEFPDAGTTSMNIGWYRNKLKNEK